MKMYIINEIRDDIADIKEGIKAALAANDYSATIKGLKVLDEDVDFLLERLHNLDV